MAYDIAIAAKKPRYPDKKTKKIINFRKYYLQSGDFMIYYILHFYGDIVAKPKKRQKKLENS